jgi:hypothetical protein
MKKLLLGVMVSLFAGHSSASSSPAPIPEAHVWKGSGTRYDISKMEQGTYELTLEIQKLSPQEQKSVATVTLATGEVMIISCSQVNSERGWSLECSNGKGGGYCFDQGMCQNYVADADGRAYATTLSFDGKDSMRLLRTELLNGKAVGFFAETLKRQ